MTIQTSHTCNTEAEARAFMRGYQLAKYAERDTEARLDPEEPFTVLLDMDPDDEGGVWLTTLEEFQPKHVLTPEQYGELYAMAVDTCVNDALQDSDYLRGVVEDWLNCRTPGEMATAICDPDNWPELLPFNPETGEPYPA